LKLHVQPEQPELAQAPSGQVQTSARKHNFNFECQCRAGLKPRGAAHEPRGLHAAPLANWNLADSEKGQVEFSSAPLLKGPSYLTDENMPGGS